MSDEHYLDRGEFPDLSDIFTQDEYDIMINELYYSPYHKLGERGYQKRISVYGKTSVAQGIKYPTVEQLPKVINSMGIEETREMTLHEFIIFNQGTLGFDFGSSSDESIKEESLISDDLAMLDLDDDST